MKPLFDEAKSEYDLKKVLAEILLKYENSEECERIVSQDKLGLITNMLDYFMGLSDRRLSLTRYFMLMVLIHFLKKAQEVNNEIFLSPEHAKKVVFWLEKEDSEEDDSLICPSMRNSCPEFKILPFINVCSNPEILDVIIRNRQNFRENFWKNSSYYLSFLYRNCVFLEKNKSKVIFASSDKMKSLYEDVLSEKLKQPNDPEGKKSFNEMLIILLRCLFLADPLFLDKQNKLDGSTDDFSFCYECFLCLSADFQLSRKYFDKNGIYVCETFKKFLILKIVIIESTDQIFHFTFF